VPSVINWKLSFHVTGKKGEQVSRDVKVVKVIAGMFERMNFEFD